MDEPQYQALFEQYFRFDVSQQRPYFYTEVRKSLRSLCELCVVEVDLGWIRHLSLMPFDPELDYRGSLDRLVDMLVANVSILSFSDLCQSDDGGVIVQQYREVYGYFNHRSSSGMPVVDDVLTMWLSYPHWIRCPELLNVVEVMFSGMLQWDYVIDFRDLGSTELNDGAMLTSLNFVRIWMTTGFAGHSRRTLAGFIRHCESTDMQAFRLQDAIRCRPWDQLVKTGKEELYARCATVLGSTSGLPELPGVDEYRSSVCDQLREMGAQTTVTRRSPGKSPGRKSSARKSGGVAPRTQEAIDIHASVATTTVPSQEDADRSKSARRSATRGRRTRGVPKKPKRTSDTSGLVAGTSYSRTHGAVKLLLL